MDLCKKIVKFFILVVNWCVCGVKMFVKCKCKLIKWIYDGEWYYGLLLVGDVVDLCDFDSEFIELEGGFKFFF